MFCLHSDGGHLHIRLSESQNHGLCRYHLRSCYIGLHGQLLCKILNTTRRVLESRGAAPSVHLDIKVLTYIMKIIAVLRASLLVVATIAQTPGNFNVTTTFGLEIFGNPSNISITPNVVLPANGKL